VKFTILPRSLAGRTAIILLIGFAVIQLLGLVIQTFNEINLARIEEQRDVATRDVIIYRHIAFAPPRDRAAMVAAEPKSHGTMIALGDAPPSMDMTRELPLPARQIMRGAIFAFGIPPQIHPLGLEMRMLIMPLRYVVSFALPDPSLFPQTPLPPPDVLGMQLMPPNRPFFGKLPPGVVWLTVTTPAERPEPWRSPGFATAFIVMMALGTVMTVWAVRQLTAPVRTLADAAERLGRDVINAPNLPEHGPTEIVTAALAFNTMASRIRRFVQDRTFLLTAIGHDLRTPITRLKLRAEYMDDDEQRMKMLADLDEMESMVAATLAFGRDIAASEAVVRMDLAVLLRTILDEAADGDPEHAQKLSYAGPEHLPVQARPLSLKRALTNLVGNALKYGDAARVSLSTPQAKVVQINIDDDGPGIGTKDSELVFEPFRRLETSRNRETGGSGLGLSIARNIIRAHGGDICLNNRTSGLRATVTLPI
jgi:two-component system OmpR family sensor kinase